MDLAARLGRNISTRPDADAARSFREKAGTGRPMRAGVPVSRALCRAGRPHDEQLIDFYAREIIPKLAPAQGV